MAPMKSGSSNHPIYLGDIGLVTTGAGNCRVQSDIDAIITEVATTARKNDHILIMSNGDFGGIHKKLLKRITDGD